MRVKKRCQKDWGAWFDGKATEADIAQLMQPYHEGVLQAREITKRITDRNRSTNVPEVQMEAPKSSLF